MKRLTFSFLLLVASTFPAIAQVEFYGFVRNYFVYDTRRNLMSTEGMFNQIPYDQAFNAAGQDTNAIPTVRFLAITTRLGVNLQGPDVGKAKLTGKVEADFQAMQGTAATLRLRQAYAKFSWQKASLLAGQTWHPLCTADNLPDVLALASGSPFEPFCRNPQLRYDYRTNALRLSAAALYQMQYTSVGPQDKSAQYANNALFPEVYGSIGYAKGGFLAEWAVDFLSICPRVMTETSNLLVNERANSLSQMLYLQYKKDLFSLKFKTLYGENTAHLNMMSGYGATVLNPDGSYAYIPLRALTSYLDIAYGKTYKFNLFAGYSKNLGSEENLLFQYNRGPKNINSMYRLVPSFSYNLPQLSLGIELESTAVTYGDLQANGAVALNDNLHQVVNHRVCLMMKYLF